MGGMIFAQGGCDSRGVTKVLGTLAYDVQRLECPCFYYRGLTRDSFHCA